MFMLMHLEAPYLAFEVAVYHAISAEGQLSLSLWGRPYLGPCICGIYILMLVDHGVACLEGLGIFRGFGPRRIDAESMPEYTGRLGPIAFIFADCSLAIVVSGVRVR